jgi:DNA-binding IclR family transcriptional regulator
MIQVIGRVFAILEELSLDGEVSLESLARITGLNKGTLCNILRTLIELGYIRRSRSSHYELTDRFRGLCGPELHSPTEIESFRREVHALAEATGESGVLTELRADRVAVVVQSQHQRTLMVNAVEIYAALSLYHSVSGRILVSYLSAEQRADLCGRTGFPGAQWDGIDSLPQLENACRKIRQSAISVMENPEQEIIAFAVPVFRPEGKIMALGLTMPLMRCPQKVREKIIAELKIHAGNLGTVEKITDHSG